MEIHEMRKGAKRKPRKGFEIRPIAEDAVFEGTKSGIGEVLKLRMMDVEDCKLFLVSPKSGRQNEVVFIPKKVAGRLREYIRFRNIAPEERIFHIGYTGARQVVKKAGRLIGLEISPHDLRRHAATYASRAGAPIEIVSKVILRHANLSTTQRYLGKVSDDEASRWVDNIFS